MDDPSDAESVLFEVERILRKSKTAQGVILYKVRWKGYGPEDDTWEPKQNLESCQDMIEDYERQQSELAKRRAEQRRAKKAMMEEMLESESSDDSNCLYPSTFKNTFWKELEAGRVNLFENDMYSKVKNKRAATQSKSYTDSSAAEESSRTCTRKQESRSRKLESRQKTKISMVSQKKSNNRSKSSKRRSFSKSFNSCKKSSVLILSDPETDENNDTNVCNNSVISDEELPKPALNIVIKKTPDISSELDTKCTFNVPEPSPCYSVLPKHIADKKETSSVSRKKKKKHHKHRKHKSAKKNIESQRKRKVSETCPGNLPEATGKKIKLENTSCNTSLEEGEIQDSTEEQCVSDKYDKVSSDELSEPRNEDLQVETLRCSTGCKESDSHTGGSLDVVLEKNGSDIKHDNDKPDSLDLSTDLDQAHSAHLPGSTGKGGEISYAKVNSVDSCRGSSISASDISVRTPGEADNSVFTNFTDSVSSSGHRASRQNSDTIDSGLCSPASEKSNVVFKKDVRSDSFGEPLPPLLSGKKSYNRGADQELEIDLDDLDWEMFDKEVNLEPVNISNSEFSEAVRSGSYELVKRALFGDGKYDMNAPDKDGRTLLMHTVQQGTDDISDLLIENGANINAQMNSGLTPLMIACHCAEVSTVNLLLELGAKVNMTAVDGRTALIIAAKRGHTQIVWLLLECGANFNLACHSGHTAMDFVKYNQHTEMENILTHHINRVTGEFNKQVSITLNQTARVISALFPAQLFNVCEGDKFQFTFHHTLLPPNSGVGYLLFIGQAVFNNQEVQCRLYGPCAVKSVYLNGHPQSKLTEGGNFVLAFSPLVNGRNVITINTVKAQEAKAKLIMCAYKAQLLDM